MMIPGGPAAAVATEEAAIAGPQQAVGAWRLGIDLGGTKTEVAVLDPSGAFRLRRREPSARGDYAGTIRLIRSLVEAAERELGASCPVGIGIPGAISPATGRVKNANSTWLNGRPLKEDLQAALARPVRIQNDANCLAVSEATDGAAAGAGCVFAAILGTGVGAGICIGGRPLTGRHAIAGEWGHNPLPPACPPDPVEVPGPRCWCGRNGCIETWLSGPALAAERTRDGDDAARARYVDRLARGLATVTNLFDPEVIVLGGGVSNLPGLAEAVEERLPAWVFSDRITTRLRRAAHGDSSGVRGAAWLWRD